MPVFKKQSFKFQYIVDKFDDIVRIQLQTHKNYVWSGGGGSKKSLGVEGVLNFIANQEQVF